MGKTMPIFVQIFIKDPINFEYESNLYLLPRYVHLELCRDDC